MLTSQQTRQTKMQDGIEVVVNHETNKEAHEFRTKKLALSVLRHSSRIELDEKTLSFERIGLAVPNFLDFLMHPEQKYVKTTLQYLEGVDNDQIIKLNQLLSTGLKELPANRKIHSKRLYYGLLADEEQFLQLLQSFDPEILKDIRIKMLKMSKEGWEKVAFTNQWKKSDTVCIEVENSMPIENIFEKESFYTIVSCLKSTEAVFLIRAFLTKQRDRGAFFYVRSGQPLDYKEILKIGGWKVENEPVCSAWKSEFILHIQRFSLPQEDLVLIVIFMEHEVTGKICNKNAINEDCTNFYNDYFFD